jgi:rRNA pseudouridine-1189 N-methylase Emg1 (Nep1/Mra1 family)
MLGFGKGNFENGWKWVKKKMSEKNENFSPKFVCKKFQIKSLK